MPTFHFILLLVSYLASFSFAQNVTGFSDLNVNLTTVQISDARGNRSVAYFVVNGYAIVEGDIIYGTEADLLSHVVGSGNGGSNVTVPHRIRRSKSIFPNTNEWPSATILYQYESAAVKSAFQSAVNGAIAKWIAAVPCLKFQEQPIGPGSPGGVTVIRAGNPSVPACFSSIGYSSGSMNILLVNGCGVPEITHELGHALGLQHEVKRYDRDLHTQFFCKNLIDYPYPPFVGFLPSYYGGGPYGGDSCCGEDYPGISCGWAAQFSRDARAFSYTDQPPDSAGQNGSPYDLDSIMHYRVTAFAKPGTQTLSKGPLSNPSDISAGDAARVRELYGCPGPVAPVCPKGCNPISGLNLCSIPTAETCIFPTAGAPTPYCACRAGYKAGAFADTDTTKQWRVNDPGQIDRVWVAEGVVCDTLCNVSSGTPSCREVSVIDDSCI